MQQNTQQTHSLQEDEIDLRELFKTLWAQKTFIVIFTTVITIISIIYVYMQNPIPLYQGKVLVEIGEVRDSNVAVGYFDNPYNLSEILKIQRSTTSTVPKSTNKLLELISINSDKEAIKRELSKSVEYILQRHKEKAKFHENFIMTEQVGDISINPTAINQPKKKLIVVVTFVTGFILSIFLVFFMQFIRGFKEEEKVETV
ncbi:MAG: Wzz/FepE/Etk N-terminal domain-containing protein [Sulfurimonadaceae bacterium]|jgi:LPS O-antigen subunit length determinant protein (WzzB/FepE family)|nr:Wzz/FepE/Etk N-terminal domain-containing protein [Sulfurimonadaceae bacterium]